MNKFLSLFAAVYMLVSVASAIPQEHLAPAVQSHGMSGAVVARADHADHLSESELESMHATMSVHPRQVRNADYGANNGPTGNPQTAQTSTAAPPQETPTGDSQVSDDSSSAKKRDFTPRPAHDVNYLDS